MNAPAAASDLAAVDYDPFADAALLARVVPTTEPQREIWLASQLSTEASLAYNESVCLHLRGSLDRASLRAALQALVDRHDALRATLSADGQAMHVADSMALELTELDLSARSNAEREAARERVLREAVEHPFDLQRGPLIRAVLLASNSSEHWLVLSAHHIVCDGWSFGVLATELPQLYADCSGASLPAAEAFADYAIAQLDAAHAPAREADTDWWVKRFDGSVPVLELPTDHARKPSRGFASLREDMAIEAPLIAAVRKLGAAQGASLFVTMFGLFTALLSRLSGQADVVVGVPAAGQAAEGATTLVGHCVNLLPIRVQADLSLDVSGLLRRVNTHVLDAYDHQQCTFGSLLKKLQVSRDPGRLPLVSVLFNLDSSLESDLLSTPGLRVELHSNPRRFENFELFLNVTQVAGGVVLECQYSTELFDAATVRRWLALYRAALERAVADPAAKLALALMPTDGDMQALARFNRTEAEWPWQSRVEDLIAAQVRATPDRIAVSSGTRQLSYRELDERANALAVQLRERGAGPGQLVGLACGRNEHLFVGVLGILKSGAGYIPLDPAFPQDRLEFMAADAKLAHVVSDRSVVAELRLQGVDCLVLDDVGTRPDAPTSMGTSDDVAYVIYTSGSTGRPKGVLVPHRTVTNLLCSVRREPGMTSDNTVLSVTTLSFDIAVSEVILPLTVGARIVVADREQATDGDRLRALVETQGVDFIDATPSTWRLLLAAGWTGGRHVTAICTGEPLPPDLGLELLPRVGQLWNGYGPTETTVWSTFFRVDSIDGPVPIGHPVANTAIHVVDSELRPVPIGVIGELFIGGAGVTLGYLGRADLTAERFLPDPFSVEPGARWYKTGDLGRWRADGVLECLGRSDQQVKVRGYRIELGEIEANLLSHPGVARALVVTREDRPGDIRLVAYVVARAGAAPTDSDMAAHLKRTLPDYMVPQHFVALTTIPLLPNGKIDRKALPAPGLSTATRAEHQPPATPLEKTVAAAMEEELGLPGLGLGDNFFTLGGHSLLAAQLASRLGQSLSMTIPLRALFDAPTTGALARWIEVHRGQAQTAAIEIPVRADQTQAPASPMQQRLWFLERLNPGRVTYNTPSAFRFRGDLDIAALEAAFNDMVRRQSTLRTAIVEVDGEPRQIVLAELPVTFTPPEDLTSVPQADRDAVLMRRLRVLSDLPFNIERAPLFVVKLFRLAPDEHALFFMPHHIIWDGWSFDLFYEEMAELYAAHCEARAPRLADPKLSYGDFAAWHLDWMRGPELARQLGHWKERLASLPEPLELPLDHPRPAAMSGAGSTEWIRLSKATTDDAHRLGQRADATLFMTLLATYALFLARLSGQNDIVIGTPVRGRHTAELEKVMGFFVNALPLRLRVDPSRPFIDTLREVRVAVLDAFAAPDVPFEQLVRELDVVRDESRSPIYQAFFSFQDARQRTHRWGSLAQEQIMLFQRGAAEDLGLWFLEGDNGLTGGLTYNTDVLSQESVARMRERFGQLLKAVIATPDAPVSSLDIMLPEEQGQLLEWNGTEADWPREATIATLLSAQASATPQSIALVSGNETLSYAQIDARSNRLARQLRGAGIGRGALVGLCLERGLDMVVAQIGVLKAGAAYVPLDPAYPTDRVLYMAEDACIALLVTQVELATALAWPRDKCLLLDEDAALIAAQADTALPGSPAHEAQPGDAAYVIYTSGSTGRPKGVVVPHGAVVNFLTSMARQPGLDADDRLVAVTTLSFDIAVLELLLPLTVGAQVVLADRYQVVDAQALRQLVESSAATVMQATPSTWRMLIDAGWTGSGTFKALIGGEALPADLAEALLTRTGELWNMYGPTETTVWSTCWRVRAGQPISIGQPIANTQVHVLDDHAHPCAIGVPGELCIGGAGVTTGYLNRPDLTAERFIVGPNGVRLYRTGDRGRWCANGTLEHLGRLDFQVKVRGHRIELGEIETQLASHPGVRRAVVVVREDRPGDTRLVAYVVPNGAMPPNAALREHLRSNLPEYMLPQLYVAIEAVPLLPNGKIDRKTLPLPVESEAAARVFSEPETEEQRAVARIWAELLGIDRISVDDNFFDLGGHSLLAMRAALATEMHFGRKVEVRRMIFESLGQIAASLSNAPTPPATEDKPPGGIVGRLMKRLRSR